MVALVTCSNPFNLNTKKENKNKPEGFYFQTHQTLPDTTFYLAESGFMD